MSGVVCLALTGRVGDPPGDDSLDGALNVSTSDHEYRILGHIDVHGLWRASSQEATLAAEYTHAISPADACLIMGIVVRNTIPLVI